MVYTINFIPRTLYTVTTKMHFRYIRKESDTLRSSVYHKVLGSCNYVCFPIQFVHEVNLHHIVVCDYLLNLLEIQSDLWSQSRYFPNWILGFASFHFITSNKPRLYGTWGKCVYTYLSAYFTAYFYVGTVDI